MTTWERLERSERARIGQYECDVWPGSEGEVAAKWKDCGPLRDLYAEIDAPVSPYCLASPRFGSL